MKISKKIKLIIAAIAVLVAGYFSIKYFLNKNPYPSTASQRQHLINKSFVTPTRILDSIEIINDLKFLSSDSCEGRGIGSRGHQNAVEMITNRLRENGLDSFDKNFIQNFDTRRYHNGSNNGQNIIGWIKGTRLPEKYIVISAHYDHLGIIENKTYYGASDNASGTACILAMAKYFKQHPLSYSIIFAAFDGEETGLEGSSYFVNHLPSSLPLSAIKLNLNIDMIARNDSNEIFACGLYQNPSLSYAVKEIQNKTNSKILMGHDTGGDHYDWTNQSDHYAFYKKNIPFLYFGVEDHIDYHQPTDTYEKINLKTYIENCNMLALAAKSIKAE